LRREERLSFENSNLVINLTSTSNIPNEI
jgi:hypothetical protein